MARSSSSVSFALGMTLNDASKVLIESNDNNSMKRTLKFNLAIIALVTLTMCGGIGCQQKPSLSSDSFRLTVRHVLDDPDVQVMVLHLEAGGSPYYQVWCTSQNGKHSNLSAFNQTSTVSERHQAEARIYAFQISPNGDNKNDYVKTSTGAGSTLREVPRGTPLNKTFSVTVQDGTYPLNVPLVIGREDGAELKLAVGLQGTLETMLGATK